jgi:hypothetical protein
MKITSVDVIKNGERDLMDAITADLDWSAVEKIFKERHNLSIEEDIEYKKGDIVVHDEHVAYRLDFAARVMVSVLLDRDGNYLSIDITGGAGEKRADLENTDSLSAQDEQGYEKVLSQMGEEEQGMVPASESQDATTE